MSSNPVTATSWPGHRPRSSSAVVGADRDLVRGAHERGRLEVVERRARAFAAPALVHGGREGLAHRHFQGAVGVLEPLPAVLGVRGRARIADEGETTVPVDADQVLGEPARRLPALTPHRRDVVHGFTREQHERHAARQCAHRLIVHRPAHHDQPVDARAELAREVGRLRAPVGGQDQQAGPCRDTGRLGAEKDRRVVRAGEVREHDPHRVQPVPGQRATRRVGAVAELVDGPLDALRASRSTPALPPAGRGTRWRSKRRRARRRHRCSRVALSSPLPHRPSPERPV